MGFDEIRTFKTLILKLETFFIYIPQTKLSLNLFWVVEQISHIV
jgi:hypothetical protein